MSYHIDLSVFKGIVEEKDIMPKALSFCNEMLENSYNEIKENLIHVPSYDDLAFSDGLPPYRLKKADILFLENLFVYKFIYWKKYKLLAVAHDTTNDAMQYIVFQNSTDQDENYETWQVLYEPDDPCRTIFKTLIDDTISGKNANAITEYYQNDPDVDPENEYFKQTYVCKQIENKLKIVKYLYDNVPDDITVFRMGAHLTDNDKIKLRTDTIKAFNDQIIEYEKRQKMP